jgi:diaminohydroxyphosphoribosylaminopyrimidine deaminase/5-amino-6-(5-phosphoribosylamino)uracil reductase
MRRALELAAAHHTHPNPRVGAVVVGQDGEIVGEAAHLGAGQPHAETIALGQAGARARGSTLYVTLEPCTHFGNTPPCVTAISAAGVSRVVVGALDPDERVNGSGVSWLRDARIDVETDVLAEEALALDPGYFHHRRTGLPRVTLKLAMTLDGSVAARDGSSRWITSEEAREDAHLLRSAADAVVVGAGTVRIDDPQLTARGLGAGRHQPRPVIVAGAGDLPPSARLWDRAPVVVASRQMEIPSGELVVVEGEKGRPEPVATARALADLGLLELLLEGGAALAGSWWRAGVVTRGIVYVAGKIGGGGGQSAMGGDFSTITDATEVNIGAVRNVGPDLRIEFE